MKKQHALLTALVAGSLHIAPAWGDEIAVSGFVKYNIAATEAPHISRQQMTGEIEAANADSIINGSKQECHGSFVLTKDQKVVGHGYCDAVDSDGDVWWLTFKAADDRSRWTVVGGTGKYDGMTGSGETFFPETSPVKAAAAAPTVWQQEYKGTINLPPR